MGLGGIRMGKLRLQIQIIALRASNLELKLRYSLAKKEIVRLKGTVKNKYNNDEELRQIKEFTRKIPFRWI